MATSDKLQKLLETKEQIRQAIIDKGVEVGDDVVFADYSNKIAAIESGGSGPDYIALRTSNHTNYGYLFTYYEGDSLKPFALENWDTSNVTRMNNLFYYCKSLTSLNINKWDTNNVTDMSYMFSYCSNLTSLDISNWDTSNVTVMTSLFSNCESLTELNLSNFHTKHVKYMSYMFHFCKNLTFLDLSNFDMTNATSTNNMFYYCSNLHTLRLDNCDSDTINKIITSSGFPTGLVDGEPRKIYVNPNNVEGLTPPDGWIFVDSDGNEIIGEKLVNYEGGMFSNNRDIEKVNVMVTKEHDNLENMFSECENLRTINGIKDWDTSNVTTMQGMFFNCKSLESLDLSSFNTSQVTNMDTMFFNCENLRELNLSNFDMCNISETWNTNMMFRECRRLHTLRLDNCSRETVEKIINSSDFPTGRAEDNWDETRKIYCNRFAAYDLTPPDDWDFVNVD